VFRESLLTALTLSDCVGFCFSLVLFLWIQTSHQAGVDFFPMVEVCGCAGVSMGVGMGVGVCMECCWYGCVHVYIHIYVYAYGVATISRLFKIIGLFVEYSLFYRALLQKRPIISRCLLIVATP